MISKEENILFAAEKLFSEQGFDKTSTREISAAANVNISMISYYFGSKEKLLERLFEMRMVEGQTYIKEILQKDIDEWQKIELIIDKYSERVRTLKEFYTIMQREQLTNKNERIISFLNSSKMGFLLVYEKLANEGFENKIFKSKPNIALLHATLVGTMFNAMSGLSMYRDYFKVSDSDTDFEENYYKELNSHLKQVLKNLLGYEEN